MPGDVNPATLRAIFAGKTAFDGGRSFAPYVGKWMQFSGTVYDVECDKYLGWSVVLDDDPDSPIQQTILYLAESESAKAEMLKKGSSISGVGNIAKCDKYTLSLQFCILN